MSKRDVGFTKVKDPCMICQNALVPAIPPDQHDMFLIMTSGMSWRRIEDGGFLGFNTSDKKFVCFLCWKLLVGFEGELNLSTDFDKSAHHPEIPSLIRKLWTDAKLTDAAFDRKGGYYKKEFVEKLRKMPESTRWRKFIVVADNPDGMIIRCGYSDEEVAVEPKRRGGRFEVFFIEGKDDTERSVILWLEKQGFTVEDHRRNGKSQKGRSDFTATRGEEKIHVEAKSMTDAWRADQALWAVQDPMVPYWVVFVYGIGRKDEQRYA